jgi:hypothetical protein
VAVADFPELPANVVERRVVLRALAGALVAHLDDADALQLAKLIEQQWLSKRSEPVDDPAR